MRECVQVDVAVCVAACVAGREADGGMTWQSRLSHWAIGCHACMREGLVGGRSGFVSVFVCRKG